MIKTLAKSIREYKIASVITPIFIVCEVILEVLIPYLMASLIDNGVDKGDMDYIWKMGLVLTLVALISLLFAGLAGKYAAVASAGFAKNLRHDMFYKIQTYSFATVYDDLCDGHVLSGQCVFVVDLRDFHPDHRIGAVYYHPSGAPDLYKGVQTLR